MKDRKGMTYSQLAQEAEHILKQAAETGRWHAVLDDLVEIRALMRMTAQAEVAA